LSYKINCEGDKIYAENMTSPGHPMSAKTGCDEAHAAGIPPALFTFARP
jgi:hypothetical protein